MPKFINLSQPQIRLLLAIVNFGVAVACLLYVRVAMRKLRWSRSNKRFMIRHDQPELFVTKLVFGLLAMLFAFGVGILLLMPPTSRSFQLKFLQLPTLEHNQHR